MCGLREPAAGEDAPAFLDALPDPRAGLTEADLQGCRFIAGEPAPLRQGMYCGAKTLPGQSWCAFHRRIVWHRAPVRGGARGKAA